jgi:hypothetical protein
MQSTLSAYPVVTLTTGVRVANFSSGHDFVFDDGSVLPACETDRVRAFMLSPHEIESVNASGKWTDIALEFKATSEVVNELRNMQEDPDVDIIMVPLVVIRCIQEWEREQLVYGDSVEARNSPFFWKLRTQRKTARDTKDGPAPIYHDRFCIS